MAPALHVARHPRNCPVALVQAKRRTAPAATGAGLAAAEALYTGAPDLTVCDRRQRQEMAILLQ
jgi:hypothetical protein